MCFSNFLRSNWFTIPEDEWRSSFVLQFLDTRWIWKFVSHICVMIWKFGCIWYTISLEVIWIKLYTTSFEVEHPTYLSVIIIVLIQYIEGLKVIWIYSNQSISWNTCLPLRDIFSISVQRARSRSGSYILILNMEVRRYIIWFLLLWIYKKPVFLRNWF